MLTLEIADEPIDSAGALALLYAATDELIQRYGIIDDDTRLALAEMRSPSGVFLVARSEGHLCGGVGLRPITTPEQHLGEVKRLWVRPDLRRRGIAARLMHHIEDHARRLGYQRLYLETGGRQPEAISLYPTLAWQPVDDFPPGAFSHEGAHRFTKEL